MHIPVPLHPFSEKIAPGISKGRSVRDGYARGFSTLPGKFSDCEKDPLFKLAFETMEGRTLVTSPRLMNLYFIITQFFRDIGCQNIIEFGAFRGGSSLFMATLLKELYPTAKLYCCDTFEGMPQTDVRYDAHSEGDFANADYHGLLSIIEKRKLDNIVILKGLFEETLPTIPAQRFGLAHIDCDIYAAAKYTQDTVWGQMTKGGYVVYDDATVHSCIGATQAVEELIMERKICSEQVYPHFVFRAHL